MRLSVRVSFKKRAEVVGFKNKENCLYVSLSAKPVVNKANVQLISLLADKLNVPKSSIKILSGTTSRTKLVEMPDSASQSLEELTRLQSQ